MILPFDLDDRVTAAAIAAAGTIIGALIQLRVAWRKEVSDRVRGVPMTKKSRRGPVLAVILLILAAGVAGFAMSQYLLVNHSHLESEALRTELQGQIAQIRESAARLERAAASDAGAARLADNERHGAEEVAVSTTLGPCHARGAAGSDAAAGCTEQEAVRVTLCASLPSAATVTEMVLYARPEGSRQAWGDSRTSAGQDVGRSRFADKPFDRVESDQTRQACTEFAVWDAERAYSARLVVRYALAPAVRVVSHATVGPLSEQR
jgi:hypothetical protein